MSKNICSPVIAFPHINKTMSEVELCKICNKVQFKYSCPKCNIAYCSLACYKSPEHQKCSEEFYKKCVEDELSAAAADNQSNEDVKKMYEILTRMNQQLDEDELDIEQPQDELDSDDDNDDDDGLSIANRLEGIDINDSDELWKHLTDDEKKDFQAMVANGDIMKLLPKYQPWWSAQSSKLVVEMSEESTPKICADIPEFSTIYSKEPPPCIHNNVWNVVTSYACTVKFFNGEHQTNAWEATNYLVALSGNLNRNTNFDDAEQAVVAIEMEALAENIALPCEEFIEIQQDSRKIMSTMNSKLAALSDTLNLLKVAKDQQFGKETKRKTCDFIQKFEGSPAPHLSKSKLNLVIKKIEFFLSFVQKFS